ncbi:MAG: alpha/beta fold hydrolase [Ardenticatenaceae bacterium]|nr:alpha/beta fold hydrolase [Ardenticatenaceae bacterium]
MTTLRIPGLCLMDHFFELPLDYARPLGEQVTVYAREVVAVGKETADLPTLLFLQGGPGGPSPRPFNRSGWLGRVLQEYRVILLDQRGTGLSSPVHYQTLARFATPQAQADYLRHFRADNIVRDAERIRRQLLGDERWSVLGQSYGGFCIATYLSLAPEGLKEAMFTGGLPPIGVPIDEVYRATYKRVRTQNGRFYERYPGDEQRVRDVVDFLQERPTTLPGGGILSPRRLQQLGQGFGSATGLETVHFLLEEAFVNGRSGPELNYTFLHDVEAMQPFELRPIYALLHEAIYCEGRASCWSAERVRAEYPEFAVRDDQPVYFTGEMIYPWMFEEYPHLRPLQETAEILANISDWPALYDVAQLQQNEVPCAAAVYYDDMYVEREFSEQTADLIKGTRIWVTNEYDHSGLRMNGEVIIDRLLKMLKGEI